MAATTPYQMLVATAQSLTGLHILDTDDPPTQQQALGYLTQNAVALTRARSILRERCEVPVRYELSFIEEHADDFSALRGLARSFKLAARQAATESNLTEAIDWCVNMLVLANAARRGGIILDFLVSSCIGAMAIEELCRHQTDFDDAARQLLATALRNHESASEPLDAILERDRRWEAVTGYVDEPLDFSDESPVHGLTAEQQAAIATAMNEIANLPGDQRDALYRDLDSRNAARLQALFHHISSIA